ncbi:MAG: DUF3667 domain-containing protein [Arenimonas sp.]
MPAVDTPAVETAEVIAAPLAATRRCENCDALLLGEHCHVCGQPTKGLVRHFSSVLGDFFDTVLNIDSRVLRTIGPLFARPGFLSLEYFAGRRVRYVTPMRMFLFLSLLAFFAIQVNLEFNEQSEPAHIDDESDQLGKASSPEQVAKLVADASKKLDRARADAANVPGAAVGIDIAKQELHERAERQLAYLKAVDIARANGKPLPTPQLASKSQLDFPVHGKRWDPQSNPLQFSWLPDRVNDALNRRMARARDVLGSGNSQKPLIDALFNVLPQTLLLLMPMFALMLKLLYWFKRRLYMEHLIVALHSHSFMALALTLMMFFSWLRTALVPAAGFWNGLLGWAMALTGIWIPVYLLLMQKRVYAQGWPMTVVKYLALGVCYSVLLGLALAAALLIGLLTL